MTTDTDEGLGGRHDSIDVRMEIFERDGVAIVEKVLAPTTADLLVQEIGDFAQTRSSSDSSPLYALRHLHHAIPAVAQIAEQAQVRSVVEQILGPGAFLVKSIFFDKTPDANWKVAWHQDLTIAVEQRMDVDGFGPWSMKDGVVHVQPPAEVLQRMLTMRIHLDDCDADNGALQVLPGSHAPGRLSQDAISEWRSRVAPVTCEVPQGGALLMRPLLLHASSPARKPLHRRVLHLEYANQELPHGLRWLR